MSTTFQVSSRSHALALASRRAQHSRRRRDDGALDPSQLSFSLGAWPRWDGGDGTRSTSGGLALASLSLASTAQVCGCETCDA